MIDFFASTTIALIVIMTLVVFFSNQRQASILKQMREVVEDWYKAQMRDRRESFKAKIHMPDVMEWVGSQVNLTVVDQGRKLDEPPAVEFLTAEGARIVISPLKKFNLRGELRAIEGKRRKVSKLVQPLLGYHPGRVKAIERSNQTVHEWYEVEIETAANQLGVNWGNAKALYFYVIPQDATKERSPMVSFDFDLLRQTVKNMMPTPQEKKLNHTRQIQTPAPKQQKKKTSAKPVEKTLAAETKGGKE
jgi:hypothetical protein